MPGIQLDPLTRIVNVNWGGGAIEIIPAAFIQQALGVTTIPNCRRLTISTWFRFPSGTQNGNYPIFIFGGDNYESSFPSYVNVTVVGGLIRDVWCDINGPVFQTSGGASSTQSLPGSTLTVLDNVPRPNPNPRTYGLDEWHHLYLIADVGDFDTEGAGGWGIASVDGTGDRRTLYAYINGISAFYYHDFPAGQVPIFGGPTGLPFSSGTGILVLGLPIGIPMTREWDGFLSQTTFMMCDFQCWFGRYLGPSGVSNFIREGKRVPTSVAEEAYGSPTVLLAKGGAEGGIINKGTGGEFSKVLGGEFTPAGAINTFSPAPPLWTET